MRVDRGGPFDAFDPLGANRQHAVLMLQDAVDQQERLADDGQRFAVEQIGADDDVRDAGLVAAARTMAPVATPPCDRGAA